MNHAGLFATGFAVRGKKPPHTPWLGSPKHKCAPACVVNRQVVRDLIVWDLTKLTVTLFEQLFCLNLFCFILKCEVLSNNIYGCHTNQCKKTKKLGVFCFYMFDVLVTVKLKWNLWFTNHVISCRFYCYLFPFSSSLLVLQWSLFSCTQATEGSGVDAIWQLRHLHYWN